MEAHRQDTLCVWSGEWEPARRRGFAAQRSHRKSTGGRKGGGGGDQVRGPVAVSGLAFPRTLWQHPGGKELPGKVVHRGQVVAGSGI